MSPQEWDSCPWDVQRAYWDGMVAEQLVTTGEPEEAAEDADGEPQDLMQAMAHRTADTGAGVIDLRAMKEQLAAR